MKSTIKLGLAAMIAVSFAACKGKSAATTGDSTTKKDTASVVDTSHKTTPPDTSKKTDTSKMKKDTTKK